MRLILDTNQTRSLINRIDKIPIKRGVTLVVCLPILCEIIQGDGFWGDLSVLREFDIRWGVEDETFTNVSKSRAFVIRNFDGLYESNSSAEWVWSEQPDAARLKAAKMVKYFHSLKDELLEKGKNIKRDQIRTSDDLVAKTECLLNRHICKDKSLTAAVMQNPFLRYRWMSLVFYYHAFFNLWAGQPQFNRRLETTRDVEHDFIDMRLLSYARPGDKILTAEGNIKKAASIIAGDAVECVTSAELP